MKNSKSDKTHPVVTEEGGPAPRPQSPQVALIVSNEAIPSPRNAQKEPNNFGETVNPKKLEETCAKNSSPGSGLFKIFFYLFFKYLVINNYYRRNCFPNCITGRNHVSTLPEWQS